MYRVIHRDIEFKLEDGGSIVREGWSVLDGTAVIGTILTDGEYYVAGRRDEVEIHESLNDAVEWILFGQSIEFFKSCFEERSGFNELAHLRTHLFFLTATPILRIFFAEFSFLELFGAGCLSVAVTYILYYFWFIHKYSWKSGQILWR